MEVKEAYENIDKIITYGFLPVGICYAGHSFVFKTITDKEYPFFNFLSKEDGVSQALYRLAYSTYLIDGNNFLQDRHFNVSTLIKFYSGLPSTLFKILLDLTSKIHKQYLDSVDYLEGFCYTNRSRHLWRVFQGNMPNSGFYNGVAGSFNLGLNNVQENWIIINKSLDDEDNYETQFRLSLMVASSFSGKAAKDMGSRFDFHKKELQELREEIRKYGHDKKRIIQTKKEDLWAPVLRTKEDIVRELNRQMSGHKDKHDLFIEKWIDNQAKAAEEAKKSVEEKQKSFRDNIYDDTYLEKTESSRIATPEDIAKIMGNKKKNKPGLALPSDAYKRSDEQERVMRKLSGTVIRPE